VSGGSGASKLHTPGELLIDNPYGARNVTGVLVAPAGPCCMLGEPPPVLSVTLYIPAGYHIDLDLPAGSTVGAVFAEGSSGALEALDPAGNSNPCAPGPHAALWGADLSVSGDEPVRVFVDLTRGADTALGAYRLTYCGSYLAELILDDLTTPSRTGIYTWRAFITPQFDATQTYELRADVPVPHVITARTRYLARSQTLVISGTVVAGNEPETGSFVRVELRPGSRRPETHYARTGTDGNFTVTSRVLQTRARQRLVFEATAGTVGPCTSPSPAPGGCGDERSSETTASFTATIPKR
jgi:hypothetical protein